MKALVGDDLTVPQTPRAPRSATPSLRMVLRGATSADHEVVDAAFGQFDLTSAASYAQFLTAHARVLGPSEALVAGVWPSWQARFPLLQADLSDLGVMVVAGDPLPLPDEAERWGILYVLEGSRLGGGLLAGRVAAGLPVRYLSAAHADGSWRKFGDAFEQAGAEQGEAWREDVIAGAKATFARFAEAASEARS